MQRPRTKLVCTIGPASVDHIRELVELGLSVARINFSHGTPETQKSAVHAVRAAAHHARRSVAVMVDLPGPKIRLAELPGGELVLEPGQAFELRTNRPTLAQEVQPGDRILLADGAAELVVTAAPGRAEAESPAEAVRTPELAVDAAPPINAVPAEASVLDAGEATAEQPARPTAAQPTNSLIEPTADEPTNSLFEPTADEPTNSPFEPTADVSATPAPEELPPATTEQPETATPVESASAAEQAEAAALVEPAPATEPDAAAAPPAAPEPPVPAAPELAPPEPAAPPALAAEPTVSVIHTEVVRGGLIRSRAGVNIPTDKLSGEALTAEDRAAIPRALELRADLIAQSFVRSADDVRALRGLLPTPGPLVVAKIETRAAVADFDEILSVADGVMVARGDLGVDLPYEQVPLVQKDLLRRAHARGRFTIVATQMLESMTGARRPTRAEASDVANAVLDGADAVMLSAETAIGAYPIEAAQAMVDICLSTEAGTSPVSAAAPRLDTEDIGAAICNAAVDLAAIHPPTDAIWCFTRTGRTAQMLAERRPRVPIVAFTIDPVVARRLAVRSGIVPVVLSAGRAGEALVEQMKSAARGQGLLPAEGGASVVLVTTSAQAGGINRLELVQV
jgi:pyruvate kinase